MDVRLKNLIQGEITNVSGAAMMAYALPKEQEATLISDIKRLAFDDRWNPEFQAKQPLMLTYLNSGANPGMARKFLTAIASKQFIFEPVHDIGGSTFRKVVSLAHIKKSEGLPGTTYDEVLQCCEVCKKRLERRRAILAEHRSPAGLNSTFHAMVNGTWTEVMSAIYLHWYNASKYKSWADEDMETLKSRLEEWKSEFFRHFEDIMSWVPEIYSWYCDKSLNILRELWDSMLDNEKRLRVMTQQKVYDIPPQLANDLQARINGTPMMYAYIFTVTDAWDAVYAHEERIDGNSKWKLKDILREQLKHSKPEDKYTVAERADGSTKAQLMSLGGDAEDAGDLKEVADAYEPTETQWKDFLLKVGGDPGIYESMGSSNDIYFYCTPRATLNTMISRCRWFIDLVDKGELVPYLLRLKAAEYLESERELEFSLDINDYVMDYANSLIERGFPVD